MVTLVGMQENFADVMRSLIELEYEAIEAYEAAINRFEDNKWKQTFHDFRQDHLYHIDRLKTMLASRNMQAPMGPSSKHWLTKGKIILAGLIGDKMILQAMKTNEEDTNNAYARSCQHNLMWEDAEPILQRCLEDERRHKAWIVESLQAM